jgi:hypothetical protein
LEWTLPILFIVVGIGFLLGARFGKDFRWGRGGRGPVMPIKLGKTICLVIGLAFTLGGLVAEAIEFLI